MLQLTHLNLHYIQLKSHHDKFDINHKNILFYHNYLHNSAKLAKSD